MFRKHLFPQTSTVLTCLLSVFLLGQPTPVKAGCGCDKAPPAPAQVHPHATYAGQEVTIFDAHLHDGQGYLVTFTSGSTGDSVMVEALATTRRDLADGLAKPQLSIPLPPLPLGPTSLSVRGAGDSQPFLVADDTALTVVPQPIALSTAVGEQVLPNFQAAVGRDGTVYVSLDLTDTTLPRTFHAQALGYPLRFTQHDVVFYNTQGFVMQLLAEDMPGLYAIDAASGVDSDVLQYSRHEFNTYFLQHDERQAHSVDASDANWHVDGTPHIDHNHLIVAIAGILDDGSLPVPGATPAFGLTLNTYSLFQHGIVGDVSVEITDTTSTYSYNSHTGNPYSYESDGDVLSNGLVSVQQSAWVVGDVTGFAFDINHSAWVAGDTILATEPLAFLPVDLPSNLEDLGSLQVTGQNTTFTLSGPASYQVSELSVDAKGTLFIDNAAGPVTLYVTGNVDISKNGTVSVVDPDPEKFAVYVAEGGTVNLEGNGTFYGVVYAPRSPMQIHGRGEFFGAFVAQELLLWDQAVVYYDTALRGQAASSGSKTPFSGPSETTSTSTGGDPFTSTDTTASEETTPQSNGPGNGNDKGKGKK